MGRHNRERAEISDRVLDKAFANNAGSGPETVEYFSRWQQTEDTMRKDRRNPQISCVDRKADT